MQQNYSCLKQNGADRNYIDQCKWHATKLNAEEKGTCETGATPL